MSDYAIFFEKDNTVYRLPVNPEELNTNSVQAIDRFEILKLGQIAVPTHMELAEYTFEAEFPHEAMHYVETSGDFKNADFYINLFKKWRASLTPLRFIASNGIGEDINSLVLIEEAKEVEKAGEEGDKYISFKLLEYRDYGKKKAIVKSNTAASSSTTKAVKAPPEVVNPKNNGFYVVKSDDTLWSIAKAVYGNGAKYTKIYEANKDKIKHPSLIYAGQKLVIPK